MRCIMLLCLCLFAGHATLFAVEGEKSADDKSFKTSQVLVQNSLGMKFISIPAGKFTMGSPDTELNLDDSHSDDESQTPVTISHSYYLAQTEVTQEQWLQLMESEPWKQLVHVRHGKEYPATHISWLAATEFCKRLRACFEMHFVEQEQQHLIHTGMISPS
jgi:formylglycine-generating enzyme required for sulfatase activity